MSGDFKAHDVRFGPKLGEALAAGPTGLQRRVEEARAKEREAALARRHEGLRGRAGEPSAGGAFVGSPSAAPARPSPEVNPEFREEIGKERGGAEQGTEADGLGVKGIEGEARALVDGVLPGASAGMRAEVAGRVAAAVRVRKSGPKGGRPRKHEGEPWKAAGVSRRTWERRQSCGKQKANSAATASSDASKGGGDAA